MPRYHIKKQRKWTERNENTQPVTRTQTREKEKEKDTDTVAHNITNRTFCLWLTVCSWCCFIFVLFLKSSSGLLLVFFSPDSPSSSFSSTFYFPISLCILLLPLSVNILSQSLPLCAKVLDSRAYGVRSDSSACECRKHGRGNGCTDTLGENAFYSRLLSYFITFVRSLP